MDFYETDAHHTGTDLSVNELRVSVIIKLFQIQNGPGERRDAAHLSRELAAEKVDDVGCRDESISEVV